MTVVLPPKPREGRPCNGCGLCCIVEPCPVARILYGEDVQAPCPALIIDQHRSWCGVVVAEPRINPERPLALAMGIGTGCDSYVEGIDP